MNTKVSYCLILMLVFFSKAGTYAEDVDAKQLLTSAIDLWRGTSSYTEMTMTIHRPEWERSVSLRAWTRGDKDSLIRVTAPTKDRGAGTLTLNNSMWTFSPKVNRVIKVPSSMMSQSWMGSDFSNKEVSKADEILHEYTHKLLKTEKTGDHSVYLIEAVPLEDAAVVWGRQIVHVRDDFVMIKEEFYDQDNILIKIMETLDIADYSGRPVATRQRMTNIEEQGRWTEITVQDVDFDLELKDSIFTLSNLRNPRDK